MLVFLAILFVPTVLTAKCCSPSTFSCTMRAVGATLLPDGTPNIFNTNLRVYYDYNQRMAKTVMMYAGKEQSSIIDYNNNVTYTLYDGFCMKNASYTEAQSPCIPDDAVLVGSQIMGSPNNSLAVNTWRVKTNDLMMKITVTNDTCALIQESIYGNINGVPGETTYIFSDITEGALPYGIFNVPPECRYPSTGPLVG